MFDNKTRPTDTKVRVGLDARAAWFPWQLGGTFTVEIESRGVWEVSAVRKEIFKMNVVTVLVLGTETNLIAFQKNV